MAMRSVTDFSGTKLLGLRVERGLTQQALSDRTAKAERQRIHRDTISRYETGETKPSPLNFGALVFALECAPEDLLDEPQAGAA